MSDEKFRLVTRSDFDGLACAVILKELGIIDEIKFVHPKDMQDGTILVSDRDISTNLPYVPGVHLAFDHHLSETIRVSEKPGNHIIDPDAPSAARVVYEYYGGKDKLPNIADDMMDAVDKSDSAQFTEDEILNPTGWVLLNYLMDSRTGLGRFKEFRVSNYQLMMQLIDYCHGNTIEDILKLPDVSERVELYQSHADKHKDQLKRCSTVNGNLVILDLRDEETIFAGNRFMIYALNPDCNISIHILWGLNQLNTVFATGGSIVNRTCNTNIGELMLKYDGGGHENAGTCQVENDDAERVLGELVEAITAAG
ncbi:MAG: exopolyphosphatase [Rhodospirillales bacterium]|jgi:nanoRNase/pAp phosphatase (c-di-AMP/oligoRNAs hydrolase)|nr:exopolyphosphatase [Rhodospirillales bacterium]MBT4038578.1 exopolyphosphatase [Rhodospirillales bacterium]MBT4625312.1 exopolyphosphatase [Rhodospirillales bacterium]MBT5353260.1 exopolyphosphatase [Rhodospirillales bacterium]MBT5520244.1 exopolyphosphatase [Rhodospirillales bacterium]